MGNSGSGKSSLALQLIERGWLRLREQRPRAACALYAARVHVVGLPKKPRVNPGTLLASQMLVAASAAARSVRAYSGMAPAELWNVEDKHDVDVSEALGARKRLDGTAAQRVQPGVASGGPGSSRSRWTPRVRSLRCGSRQRTSAPTAW